MRREGATVHRLRGGDADGPDLGDFVVVFLAATLAAVRDQLARDGFRDAADLVADLVEISDDYLTRVGG